MTDDRWRQVEALCHEALARAPDDRAAFLAQACAGDDELQREVASLLAHEPNAAGFMSGPAPFRPSALLDHAKGMLVGRQLGAYDVRALLGVGGMGEVYRAHDHTLGREVAIKVLPAAYGADPPRRARLEREARLLASLNHPNICAIHGLAEVNGIRFLVLELVEGETLADRLQSRGGLPLGEALTIAHQIIDALDAAHEKGIVHRDLKPANITITRDAVVKVLDFGLAKIIVAEDSLESVPSAAVPGVETHEGVLLGTAAYMSPEQVRGQRLDKRTDIWSFGCVLFEMLTGRAAFGGETISDTIAGVLDRNVDWQALPASTPRGVRDLLRRCIQKDSRLRLRDIGDVRIELDEASRMSDATDAPRVHDRRSRGRVISALAIALVSLAALAAGYVAASARAPVPVFRQLTFRHGTIGGARLAGDGRSVVYRATWSGAQPQLFLIRPESLQSGAIGLQNAGIYSVSPRGDMAVSLGCRLNWGECLGTLALVPILGGRPREVVKDVLGADWDPEGKNLAVVSFSGDSYRLQYPIDRVLYETRGWITSARVSPKGDYVAFLDHDRLGDSGGSVAIIDLLGRKRTLSARWQTLQGLAWSGNGDEIWFSGSRSGKGGSSTLVAVTLAGRERPVFSSPGTLKLNDVSHDGTRVLLTRGTMRGGIIGLEGADDNERDLSWFDFSTVADLSSDGKTLLFYEWGEGVSTRSTVFIRRTDGGDPVRLGEGRPLALSPDSRWVIAIQEDRGQQLALLPTATGELKRLPRGVVADYLDWAAWSPDGRRIYFAGRESPDIRRTYVQDIDGGEPHAVTPAGFVGIAMAPDARTILTVDRYGEYYLCSSEQRTEPRALAGYHDGDVPLQWSNDGRFLFLREAGNLTLRIYTLDLMTGARQFWKELRPPDPTVLIDIGSDPGQVRVTRDGKSYAYTYWTFDGELYLAEGLK